MKRRSFLKVLGAGVGFVMMPKLTIEAAKDTSIATCADLTAAMETMFSCKMGEPRAFMEFTLDQASRFFTPAAYAVALKNTELVNKKEEETILQIYKQGSKGYIDAMAEVAPKDGIIRLAYQTFAYAIEGGTSEEAEKKLSNYFYNQFKELDENDKKMLVWRVKPMFSSEPITKYGKVWMTKEQIEDRVDLRDDAETWLGTHDPKTGHYVRWAFTIPKRHEEPPIMVPDRVEYDFMTDSLRYVEDKTTLHKLRMRFVMPEMTFEAANPLVKPEGVPVQRITL